MPQEQFQSEEKRNQNPSPESSEGRTSRFHKLQVAQETMRFEIRRRKKTFEGKVLSTSPPELGTLNVSRTKFERSSLPLR